MTYTIVVKFTTDEDSDEHLDGEDAISNEVTSWLESLNADVKYVSVEQEAAL